MLRLLLALTAATVTVARADTTPLAREVESVCRDASLCVPLRGRNLAQELACAAEDATAEEEEAAEWSFDLTAYWTNPPDDDAYGSAIFRADHGALHLEARYNYEDIDTGSLWAGWTFSWSGAVEFSLVPMVGGVFGHTQGVAPGLEFDLVWKILELYFESEYVFDAAGRDDDFFYLWAEFTVNPVEWLSVGLVAQRTRAYDTDVEVDRGLLVGFHVRSVTATVYVFNLDQDDPYVMIGVGVSF
jgi:hypothetical protein